MHKFNCINLAFLCATILSIPGALFGDELSFESASPEFSATMLRGQAIGNDLKGKIHVVEFGGTKCVPCIKFIPEMNSLQDRYPNVIFVSVFCESLDDVVPFMDGLGKEMRVRVATDKSGRMKKEWLDASGLAGVPQAFIVDTSGRLAWFGYPEEKEFGEILDKIVEGTYDGRLENMRMELRRKVEEEQGKQFQWIDKVNEVVGAAYACKTPQESIDLIDKSLPEFAGSPERISLSAIKLDFYKNLPHSREQAYAHALSLAVEAINERNPNHYVSACEAMLAHSESALGENRDSRLTDLALTVLLDETAPTNHVSLRPDAAINYQANRLAAIANARRLRGELPLALEELGKAIAVLRQHNLMDKPEWWLDQQKQTLSKLESKLAAWKEEREPKPPK